MGNYTRTDLEQLKYQKLFDSDTDDCISITTNTFEKSMNQSALYPCVVAKGRFKWSHDTEISNKKYIEGK